MKKIIPILLCIALVLSVAGCTKNKQKEQNKKNTASTGTEMSTEEFDPSKEDIVTIEFDDTTNSNTGETTTKKGSSSKQEGTTKKQEGTTKQQGTTKKSGGDNTTTTQESSSEGFTTPIIPLP